MINHTLLTMAWSAHWCRNKAMTYRKGSRDRGSWLDGARRNVRDLASWYECGDGMLRNRFGERFRKPYTAKAA